MIITLALLAFGILTLISGLHIYWAFGGRWGGSAVLPSKPGGGNLFTPGMKETLVVAVMVMAAALLLLAQSDLLTAYPPDNYTKWGCLICAFVFLIRTVGDFKYIGFTKSIKGTAFAINDTRYYSPLCLFLAVVFVVSAAG